MISSYSHHVLQTFRDCPRKFKFEKIDKVDVPSRVTAETYLGNAVHRQLQTAYQWAMDGKLIGQRELLEQFDAEWNKAERHEIVVTNEHMAVEDYIELGRKMLTRYWEKFQPFDQGVLLGAEMNLTFSFPGTPFKFRGRVDRLWKRPDNVVEIWDYKTGSYFPRGCGDDIVRRQMALYQLGVQSMYPNYTDIELVQYYLKHGEELRCRLREDEMDELAELFRQDVVAILHAVRLDDFPPREGTHCTFCDYFHLCPAKRHRQILESEAGKGGGEKTTMQTAAELAEQYIALDSEVKKLKAEQDALREDIIRAARDLDLSKLSALSGDITVRLAQEEKLPLKSKEPQRYGELASIVRRWGLDECFTLDNTILMRDIIRKGRLTEDQKQAIADFIDLREQPTVRVRRKRGTDDGDDD